MNADMYRELQWSDLPEGLEAQNTPEGTEGMEIRANTTEGKAGNDTTNGPNMPDGTQTGAVARAADTTEGADLTETPESAEATSAADGTDGMETTNRADETNTPDATAAAEGATSAEVKGRRRHQRARQGKVAALPARVRELVNQRLWDGELSGTILPWLNELPEVKRVLAERFEGRPIERGNLSEWRRGGYREWLGLRQQTEGLRALAEYAQGIALTQWGEGRSGGSVFTEAASVLASAQLLRILEMTRRRLDSMEGKSRREQMENKSSGRASSPPAPLLHEMEEREAEAFGGAPTRRSLDPIRGEAHALPNRDGQAEPGPEITEGGRERHARGGVIDGGQAHDPGCRCGWCQGTQPSTFSGASGCVGAGGACIPERRLDPMEGKNQGVSDEGRDAFGGAPNATCEAHALPNYHDGVERSVPVEGLAGEAQEGASGCVGVNEAQKVFDGTSEEVLRVARETVLAVVPELARLRRGELAAEGLELRRERHAFAVRRYEDELERRGEGKKRKPMTAAQWAELERRLNIC